MSVLAPGYLVAALAAAIVVVAAHLISWRRPTDELLPTARFVPDEPTRRSARAIRLSDLALLALRLAVVALAGLALARPVVQTPRAGVARVVAVERSRAVADPVAAADTALAWLDGAATGVVLTFDTVAAAVSREALRADTTAAVPVGRLTSALVALLRAAQGLRARHERVELAIVSPIGAGSVDAATMRVRALWPDSLHLVRVAPATREPVPMAIDIRGADDDPVAAGIRLALAHGVVHPVAETRVVRRAATPDDSAWARNGERALVVWPLLPAAAAAGTGGESGATVAGVYVEAATVPGYFRARELDAAGTPVAWWLDGRVAARQRPEGQGCVRDVAFDLPDEGDLALTPGFQRLLAVLLAPCGRVAPEGTLDEAVLTALAAPDTAPASLSARASRTGDQHLARPNPWGAVLLAGALVLLAVEHLVRQRRRGVPETPEAAA